MPRAFRPFARTMRFHRDARRRTARSSASGVSQGVENGGLRNRRQSSVFVAEGIRPRAQDGIWQPDNGPLRLHWRLSLKTVNYRESLGIFLCERRNLGPAARRRAGRPFSVTRRTEAAAPLRAATEIDLGGILSHHDPPSRAGRCRSLRRGSLLVCHGEANPESAVLTCLRLAPRPDVTATIPSPRPFQTKLLRLFPDVYRQKIRSGIRCRASSPSPTYGPGAEAITAKNPSATERYHSQTL
jgi:hypothetical protein